MAGTHVEEWQGIEVPKPDIEALKVKNGGKILADFTPLEVASVLSWYGTDRDDRFSRQGINTLCKSKGWDICAPQARYSFSVELKNNKFIANKIPTRYEVVIVEVASGKILAHVRPE